MNKIITANFLLYVKAIKWVYVTRIFPETPLLV